MNCLVNFYKLKYPMVGHFSYFKTEWLMEYRYSLNFLFKFEWHRRVAEIQKKTTKNGAIWTRSLRRGRRKVLLTYNFFENLKITERLTQSNY